MQYTDLAIARPAAEIRYRARAKSVGRIDCSAAQSAFRTKFPVAATGA
jgi:hypothetical protein